MRKAKKVLSLLLCAILASGSAAAGGEGVAQALDTLSIRASAQTYSDLEYEINDGEVTITGCNETVEGALEIPSTIDGFPVTSMRSLF